MGNRIAGDGSVISKNGKFKFFPLAGKRPDDFGFIIRVIKKAVLILSLFTGTIDTSAQEPQTEELKQELRAHPQEDAFRANKLNELAAYPLLTDDEKEKFATEALAISRKTVYAKGEGYALMYLGSVQYDQGNLRESDLLYQQAELIANKTG